MVGVAKLVCMTNYVPKEKPPPIYEALKATDPKLPKEFKKMKIQELKYNKYVVKEASEQSQLSNNYSQSFARGSSNNYSSNAHRDTTGDRSPDMSPMHLYQGIESDVKEIRRFIKTLIYKQKTQENLEKIRGEWRAVALVLDRSFFYLYLAFLIISLATMFPRGT